ncbi:hypothetical protein BpHYR1_001850 [Brachionus plicatilis]|uniref:Uncharacterized protein n=1 Tax=Brachionus plicatilis TaxID=10195 RepID=A0A3M7PZG4_BRAPC|nr:hypothetical protein BpHYR1_001850 [Brachionus plicatilis]
MKKSADCKEKNETYAINKSGPVLVMGFGVVVQVIGTDYARYDDYSMRDHIGVVLKDCRMVKLEKRIETNSVQSF